jgi:amidohydrolase
MTPQTATAIEETVEALLPRARDIRHDLHRHPELGYEETRTNERVQAELGEAGVAFVNGIAGTGVLAHLPATESPGKAPTVALRADMDALPITEETGLPYASTTPGLMHACGHDGHTAILLATAHALAKTPHRPNNVTFLFQPAEEGGAGGERMCEEGALDGSRIGPAVDAIYGLHGWPELNVGKLATRVGPLLASTDEFCVTIRGKGGHAAYPHFCTDPVVIASHVVVALQTIASRRTNPVDPLVITVGAIHAGTTFNVIPDAAQLKGTIRTLNEDTRSHVEEEFHRVVGATANALGGRAEIDWHVGYPTTINDEALTRRFQRLAEERVGETNLIEKPHASMGGEDFSFYGRHIPASFFLLGLKPPDRPSCPLLHTPQFDFNDDAIPLGVSMMCRLALAPLKG